MSTDDPQKLDSAIEQIEAEIERRLEERIEQGKLIRAMLEPVVVGRPESAAPALAKAKGDRLAEIRATGDQREVLFEFPLSALPGEEPDQIEVIITGVPRADRWEEAKPKIGDMKDIPGQGVHKWTGEAWERMPYGTWTGKPPLVLTQRGEPISPPPPSEEDSPWQR